MKCDNSRKFSNFNMDSLIRKNTEGQFFVELEMSET